MISIKQVGQLYEIAFSHPMRDQFDILKDAVKEIGAVYDAKKKVWVVAESKKADVLNQAKLTSSTPADLLQNVRKLKVRLLDLPVMDGPIAPDWIKPMEHQSSGVQFVADREGSLIAWEVGTGKTGVSIASINAAKKSAFPCLIICPAHLKRNWYSELKGDPALNRKGWLLDPNATVGIAAGGYFPPTDIVIINYDILDRHKGKLDAIDWKFVFCDEAHFIKNPKAKRTKAIIGEPTTKKKAGVRPLRAKRRVCLTGTPMVNKPEDIFSICNWLDPKNWPSRYWFENTYCTTQTRKQWVKRGGQAREITIRELLPPSKSQMDALNKRLNGTVMSRVRSRDVLDLPPLTRRVIEIDISEGDAIRAETKALELTRPKYSVLVQALELAKAVGTDEEYAEAVRALAEYRKQEEEHVAILRQKVALAKVPYVLDHIRSVLLDPERKVLLFAHHHSVIQALEAGAKEFMPDGVVSFYGKSSAEEKRAAEVRVQTDPNCRLFIGGITAAGTGITLTGACHVIFAEEDWVPANSRQCEGRAWRKGQKEPVLVEHLVAYGSIDARIAKMVVAKQEVADQAIDGDLILEEPIDWLADHLTASRQELEESATRIKPLQIAAYQYGLHSLVSRPKEFGVSDIDLILASRLSGRKLEGRAAAYARQLAIRYLGAKEDDCVDIPSNKV